MGIYELSATELMNFHATINFSLRSYLKHVFVVFFSIWLSFKFSVLKSLLKQYKNESSDSKGRRQLFFKRNSLVNDKEQSGSC